MFALVVILINCNFGIWVACRMKSHYRIAIVYFYRFAYNKAYIVVFKNTLTDPFSEFLKKYQYLHDKRATADIEKH